MRSIRHRRQKSEADAQRAARAQHSDNVLLREDINYGSVVRSDKPLPWKPKPITPPIKEKSNA